MRPRVAVRRKTKAFGSPHVRAPRHWHEYFIGCGQQVNLNNDPGLDYYEQKYQSLMLKKLQKKAESLGLELVPKPTIPADVS